VTPAELLRDCAVKLENGMNATQLHWPKGCGRFPFLGGTTELCCVNDMGSVYRVSVRRVLQHVAKGLS